MKLSTIEKLTWQDIREIVTEAHMMSTIPETETEYFTPEAYYTAILDRLRHRNAECIYGYTEEHKALFCRYCSIKCDAKTKEN